MAANNIEIANRLAADLVLVGSLGVNGYSGILRGGIWTRFLRRAGAGRTPEAFYLSDKGLLVRPAAVILDDDENDHPQESSIPTAYNQLVNIHLYVPSTASGKEAAHAARRRIFALLDFERSLWRFTTDDGTLASLKYIDRTGLRDSEEFTATKFTILRYQLRSRHADAT
jgi:hypothetical protein